MVGRQRQLFIRDVSFVAWRCVQVLWLVSLGGHLSWWLVLDDSLTTGLGLPKLEGLPSHSEMIALWEQSSGYSAAALDYYELLSNFQFAVIMHRVGTRLTAQGIFQAEDEFDMNNNSTLLIDEQIAKFGIDKVS